MHACLSTQTDLLRLLSFCMSPHAYLHALANLCTCSCWYMHMCMYQHEHVRQPCLGVCMLTLGGPQTELLLATSQRGTGRVQPAKQTLSTHAPDALCEKLQTSPHGILGLTQPCLRPSNAQLLHARAAPEVTAFASVSVADPRNSIGRH